MLRATWLTKPGYPALALSGGFGWHTFNGGTIPEKFSRAAFIGTVGLVYPNPGEPDWVFWGTKADPIARAFIEGGAKFRWFPDGLLNSEFGGINVDDETDTLGTGAYAMIGIRFGR